MVSATQQTFRIRRRKARAAGSVTKRQNRNNSTPTFPVQPEGYDLKAADAKPLESAASPKKPATAQKAPEKAKTAAKKKA